MQQETSKRARRSKQGSSVARGGGQCSDELVALFVAFVSAWCAIFI